MIALLAALVYFTIVPTPPQIHSTFELHGLTFEDADDTAPKEDATTLPYLKDEDGTPTLMFSFHAPVGGTCRVYQIVTKDGVKSALPLASHEDVEKDSVQMGHASLTDKDEMDSIGVTSDGYTVFVGCADPDNAEKTVQYSKVYHVAAPLSPA